MNKEELLNELQRNEHLKDLLSGTLYGPLTGKPSVDKPWLKNYSYDAVTSDIPYMTCYDYLYKKNKDFILDPVIDYFNFSISYKQLFKNIDDVTKSLLAIGVTKGDIVSALIGSTPEAIYLFYALNRIGAIYNPIDPRYKSDSIISFLNRVNPKYLIAMDMCQETLKTVVEKHPMDKIIITSGTESLPKLAQLAIAKKKEKQGLNIKIDNQFLAWNNFMQLGKNYHNEFKPNTDSSAVTLLIYTGGTTGTKKGVYLNSDNINAMVYQHEKSGIPFDRGDRYMEFMPTFIVYGLVMGIHMPLCVGFKIILLPIFKPDDFNSILMKKKPNFVPASPVHYELLLKKLKDNEKAIAELEEKRNKLDSLGLNKNDIKKLDKLINKIKKDLFMDLSFLKTIYSGGDSMSLAFEQEFNKYLQKYNAECAIGQGLGMTEAGGTISVPINNKIKKGSVGIPLPLNIIKIVSLETGKELPINENGEICLRGPSTMISYDNKELNSDIYKMHDDGYVWLHTGDVGHLDKDGYLYHVSRIKRIINRNGLKVYPVEIEAVINQHPEVISTIVVGVSNENERNVPIANVLIDDTKYYDFDRLKEEIMKLCHNNLENESIPYDIQFIGTLPYTANGKVDYRALEDDKILKKCK